MTIVKKGGEVNGKGEFVKGMTLGAIIGGALGVLMAPKSGKETREDIAKTYNDIKADLSREISRMGEITKEKYNTITQSVVAGYKEAKRITPEQSREILDILEDSFIKIEKAAKKASK